MLNRDKLAKDITALAHKLFAAEGEESTLLKTEWEKIAGDPTFAERAAAAESSFLVPSWKGNLLDQFPVAPSTPHYSVVAVDGSQIYPDRHISGAGCFLLNVGGAIFEYGEQSTVQFFSEPRVLMMDEVKINGDAPLSPEMIDLLREACELKIMVQKAAELKKRLQERGAAQGNESDASLMPVCLLDGTIIFWNLDSRPPEVKAYFLEKYLHYLAAAHKEGLLEAGFISFPKSRELVSLIKLGLCRFKQANCIPCHSTFDTFPCEQANEFIDTQVTKTFLKRYHRTTIFYNNSKISSEYPAHLKPCFFYLDIGKETARIEIPRWIADNDQYVDLICRVALDQSLKGFGYPVCLAESHEQAVVKGADRDFFYHLIYRAGLDQQRPVSMSQKSIKKRQMGV